MSEHETRDFMSVDSFSQLPFIRPSAKPSNSPVRLFGYDFPQNSSSKETSENNTTAIVAATTTTNKEKENITGRKFECHYCCRNFPTSQALGGHQNAHKRERQQAKRAHLQTAMAAAHAHHHHHHAGIAEGHMYGILNYHRLAGSTLTGQHGGGNHNHHHHAAHHGIESPTGPPPHYPSWTTTSGVGARFYGGLGSVSQPITGNPLPGLWMTHRDNNRSLPLPLFESRPVATLPTGGAISLSSSSSSPSSSNSQSAKDQNVSLDLHL